MGDGWIYVWKLDVHLQTDKKTPELCLLKVGIAEKHRLFKRLYDEALSWGKIFGPKTRDYRSHDAIDIVAKRPRIPVFSSVEGNEVVRTQAEDVLSELMEDEKSYPDLACFFPRSEDEGHDINQDERYLSSLIGLPVRSKFIDGLRLAWNARTRYNASDSKKLGEIKKCQIAPTEYIVATRAVFETVRQIFRNAASLDAVSLAAMTDAVAALAIQVIPNVLLSIGDQKELHAVRIAAHPVEASQTDRAAPASPAAGTGPQFGDGDERNGGNIAANAETDGTK